MPHRFLWQFVNILLHLNELMANRDFDPFASASHGPEAFNPEFLPPLAKEKLDEFFLQVSDLFSSKNSIFYEMHFIVSI